MGSEHVTSGRYVEHLILKQSSQVSIKVAAYSCCHPGQQGPSCAAGEVCRAEQQQLDAEGRELKQRKQCLMGNVKQWSREQRLAEVTNKMNLRNMHVSPRDGGKI